MNARDRIPKGAVLVILPEDDEVLYDENYKVLEENYLKERNSPILHIYSIYKNELKTQSTLEKIENISRKSR